MWLYLFIIVYGLICMYLGYIYRDAIIRKGISVAMKKVLGDDNLLSGNVMNYIHSFNVLSPEQIDSICNSFPPENELEPILVQKVNGIVKYVRRAIIIGIHIVSKYKRS